MVDHRHQVIAAHPPGGPHLLLEPVAELGVVPELAADQLQRDGLPAPGVRETDGAHAALADAREQPVPGDLARIVRARRGEHVADAGIDGDPRSRLRM